MKRAALATMLALAPLATACSGDSASRPTEPQVSGGGNQVQAAGGQAMVDAQLAMARCMRQQGIDFPDPRPGGGFEFDPAEAGVTQQRVEAAEENCQDELKAIADAAPQPSPEQLEEDREATLRFARCMRDHGQDVPDPTVGGEEEGTSVSIPSDAKSNPAFLAAQRKCDRLLRGLGPQRP